MDFDGYPPPWLAHLLTPTTSAAPAGSVTFPSTQLRCRVLIALGADLTQPWYTWSWTDITQWVRFGSGITVTQGRQDETSVVQYGRGELTLDNRDGRFSRRNPNGPYYGLLTINTPIWGTVDAGTGEFSRLQQFVVEWPTRWDISGKDSTVPIQTAGVMRRLQQGSGQKSALRRTLTAVTATTPVAYWPLEDGADATVAASGLPGGAAAAILTGPTSTVSTIPGAAQAPLLTTPLAPSGAVDTPGNIQFAIPPHTVGTETLTFWTQGTPFANPPTGGVQVTVTHVLTFVFGGGIASATVSNASYDPTGGFTSVIGLWVQFFAPDGTFIDELYSGTAHPAFDPFDGSPHQMQLQLVQSGSDIVASIYFDGTSADDPITMAGRTLTAMALFRAGGTGYYQDAANLYLDPLTVPYALSHLTVHNSAPTSSASAGSGYAGETGPARIVRVAAEEGVAMACTGSTAPSPPMGPQPVGKLLDVLRDAEAVDQGVLYETAWGLGYIPLADRYNAPVSLALDFDQRHIAVPPEPADDDQRLRNRWTASRPGGSSATVELTTGPTGTGTAGPGVYEDSVSANVQSDSQLPDQAGWRRSLGTVDEDRWPSIAIRLHGTPDLIPSWAAMPFGGRMTATNPPSQVAPDTIDTLREGWVERWDPETWVAELNASPFTPYRIGTLAADTSDTAQTTLILTPDTLTLAADVSTTDVTWSINSSPIWTVNAESFPRYIWWEGEVIQLTNCVGGSAPQTWTVVRSINGVVKAHLANSSGHIYRPGALALA